MSTSLTIRMKTVEGKLVAAEVLTKRRVFELELRVLSYFQKIVVVPHWRLCHP